MKNGDNPKGFGGVGQLKTLATRAKVETRPPFHTVIHFVYILVKLLNCATNKYG